MVYITEDLVRRRAEHNDCEIWSLEEVSLHQQDLERIQHLDRWCRDLRILYLQSNLIPRIENVGRLKKLEYLNLALNNIEVIENLEGCESLQKLDLTVNFVGRLSSVESLRLNLHLKELYLVGNPCASFTGYRQYVVAALPQLKSLDGTEISRSERIRALQGLEEVRVRIQEQEEEYVRRRNKEKEEAQKEKEEVQKEEKPGFNEPVQENQEEVHQEKEVKEKEVKEEKEDQKKEVNQEEVKEKKNQKEKNQEEEEKEQEEEEVKKKEHQKEDQEEEEVKKKEHQKKNQEEDQMKEEEQKEREFWNTPCPFTPESRLETYRHLKDMKKTKDKAKETKLKVSRTLITAEGRVLNVNEPKLDFTLTEDEENNNIVLDLEVYRHLDTSLIDVDVQPKYVRVTVKGKVFQLALASEVTPDLSVAQRSQTTGHLLLSMPKVGGVVKVRTAAPRRDAATLKHAPGGNKRRGNAPERLEVDSSQPIDFRNIVPRHKDLKDCPMETSNASTVFSQGFVDDPEVPPLV